MANYERDGIHIIIDYDYRTRLDRFWWHKLPTHLERPLAVESSSERSPTETVLFHPQTMLRVGMTSQVQSTIGCAFTGQSLAVAP